MTTTRLEINGTMANVVMIKGIQNNGAWLNVYVDNSENVGVPVACHCLPKEWVDGKSNDTIRTGGNEYKKVK